MENINIYYEIPPLLPSPIFIIADSYLLAGSKYMRIKYCLLMYFIPPYFDRHLLGRVIYWRDFFAIMIFIGQNPGWLGMGVIS